MNYSALTRQWFEAAGEAVELEPARAGSLACGSAGSIEQGTWVQFDVRVAAESIESARFLAFGCPHTIAIAAWLTGTAPRLPLRAQLPESARALQQRFEVPVEKLGRILLIEDAWCAAISAAITKFGAGMV